MTLKIPPKNCPITCGLNKGAKNSEIKFFFNFLGHTKIIQKTSNGSAYRLQVKITN